MAYDQEKIYKQALKIAEKNKCLFIESVVHKLPISRQTFYDFFPLESDKLDTIKDICHKNRVDKKNLMYNKWFESENPTLQVALMKLIAEDDQADRLNGSRQKIEHSGNAFKVDEKEIEEKLKIAMKIING
jgi:hypothetical protein